MAIATPTRPTISTAIDALAELQSARDENYAEAESSQTKAVSPERARRLAILFQMVGEFNAWQLEALLRQAAYLRALVSGEDDEPTWDYIRGSVELEVQRLKQVVEALGFWGDEGIGYRRSSHVDAA